MRLGYRALDEIVSSRMASTSIFSTKTGIAPFVRRVRIRNFKSIGHCDIDLGSLTILVGQNGSGKSNFLDALRFVVDGLKATLDYAIKSRGGIDAVRRKSTGHPRNFSVDLFLNLSGYREARYGFEIAAQKNGGFLVKEEYFYILEASGDRTDEYKVNSGQLVLNNNGTMPAASADRLYLVNASGLPQYREVYDGLLAMGFYNLNPEALKALQSPDSGEILQRDGSNIASVIHRIANEEPKLKKRFQSYLSSIVPGITDVNRISVGPKETLEFRQNVAGAAIPWKFYADSMSDGTLRVLGTLVAVMQVTETSKTASLVGIEEPETALHPAASGALMDALREATGHTQIIVTSHSPDLLDQVRLETDQVLVVQARAGETQIAPMNEANKLAIRDHLFTLGQLLSLDQLLPDQKDINRQSQISFSFDEMG